MSRTVSMIVSHELGRDVALTRLREGASRADEYIGRFGLTMVEQDWRDNACSFGVAVLGYTVRGRLEVEERQVRIEVDLPWVLAVFAEKTKATVEKQGTILLGKPDGAA